MRFSFPFGGVPLASMGISQVGGPFAGIARVGGVILLTWVVMQVGFAIGAIVETIPTVQPNWQAFGGIATVAVIALLAVVAPRGNDTGAHARRHRRPGRREAGHERARGADPRGHRTARRGDARRSSPTSRSTSSLWPENVIDTADFATSDQFQAVAAEAQRLGVPLAVGVTEDVPGEPGRITNAQVVVTPEGEITSRYDKVRRVPFGEYVPLRGFLESLGAPVDQVAHGRHRRHRAGRPRPARRHPARRRDLVGGVLRRPGARRPSSTAARSLLNPTNGASYTGHDRADPAGRVEPAAGDRDRPLGRAGGADRVLGVRHPGRDGHRPHGGERAGRHPPRRRAPRRPHVVRHRSATGRGSCSRC